MSSRRRFVQSLGLLAAGAVVPLPRARADSSLMLYSAPAEHRTLPPPEAIIKWGKWRYYASYATGEVPVSGSLATLTFHSFPSIPQ